MSASAKEPFAQRRALQKEAEMKKKASQETKKADEERATWAAKEVEIQVAPGSKDAAARAQD